MSGSNRDEFYLAEKGWRMAGAISASATAPAGKFLRGTHVQQLKFAIPAQVKEIETDPVPTAPICEPSDLR